MDANDSAPNADSKESARDGLLFVAGGFVLLVVALTLDSSSTTWVHGPIYVSLLLCLVYLRYRLNGENPSKFTERLPPIVRQILWGCISPPVVGMFVGLWLVRWQYLAARSNPELWDQARSLLARAHARRLGFVRQGWPYRRVCRRSVRLHWTGALAVPAP